MIGPNQHQHLTDEQFTDLLLGASPASVQAHLRSCAQCAAEAERVSAAIGSFQQQSRLWAERRAATLPAVQPKSAPAFWPLRPQAWAAAALVLAIAAGFGVAVREHHAHGAKVEVATNQSAPQVAPATLKSDNELLAAINVELNADDSTPASVYSLTAARHGNHAQSARKMSE